MNVIPSKKISIFLNVADENKYMIEEAKSYIEKLAGVGKIEYTTENIDKASVIITKIATIQIPLGELVDIAVEIERLEKELKTVNSEIKRAERMLANEGFVAKAPAKLIENEKEKLTNYTEKAEKIKEQIKDLKD